jgi:hypothetical protein
VARRTMTLKRVDPWSVLKFGFLVNLCLLAVALLAFVIVWFVVQQLGIIEQACQLALDVGFEECGVDGGALFRAALIVGTIGAVILTGIVVFGAFLHNLLADLVGGLRVTLIEEGVPRAASPRAGANDTTRRAPVGGGSQARPDGGWTLGTPPPRTDDTGQDRTEATSTRDATTRGDDG